MNIFICIGNYQIKTQTTITATPSKAYRKSIESENKFINSILLKTNEEFIIDEYALMKTEVVKYQVIMILCILYNLFIFIIFYSIYLSMYYRFINYKYINIIYSDSFIFINLNIYK